MMLLPADTIYKKRGSLQNQNTLFPYINATCSPSKVVLQPIVISNSPMYTIDILEEYSIKKKNSQALFLNHLLKKKSKSLFSPYHKSSRTGLNSPLGIDLPKIKISELSGEELYKSMTFYRNQQAQRPYAYSICSGAKQTSLMHRIKHITNQKITIKLPLSIDATK
jgi:hypothetical protein